LHRWLHERCALAQIRCNQPYNQPHAGPLGRYGGSISVGERRCSLIGQRTLLVAPGLDGCRVYRRDDESSCASPCRLADTCRRGDSIRTAE